MSVIHVPFEPPTLDGVVVAGRIVRYGKDECFVGVIRCDANTTFAACGVDHATKTMWSEIATIT